ncbi:MAG: MBL fold metallo-hydrolase [Lachnospiraceae bacterium]|nr:MBL fold metallo-hydrolase [Lachnospiraceae bacterium]
MITELKYCGTNTYLVEGSKGILLFDTGWAGTFRNFCHELGEKGKELQKIDAILISHFHPDHMGIAQEIADHGAKIVILDIQKPFLHNADPVFEKEPGMRFFPIRDEAVRVITEEESPGFLTELGLSGKIIPTPGHSDDSITLWLDNGVALAGDLNPLYELELHQGTQIEKSWEKILSLDPSMIYYGHARTTVRKEKGPGCRNDPENEEKENAGQGIEERSVSDHYELVSRMIRMIDKGYSIDKIKKKTGADPVFIEDVSRMYLTHPGVSIHGILDRIEIKNR